MGMSYLQRSQIVHSFSHMNYNPTIIQLISSKIRFNDYLAFGTILTWYNTSRTAWLSAGIAVVRLRWHSCKSGVGWWVLLFELWRGQWKLQETSSVRSTQAKWWLYIPFHCPEYPGLTGTCMTDSGAYADSVMMVVRVNRSEYFWDLEVHTVHRDCTVFAQKTDSRWAFNPQTVIVPSHGRSSIIGAEH